MLLPSSFLPTMPEYAVAFFLNTLLFCILTPLQYQFGFENSKFVLVIIIMASCFLLPVLLKKNALQPAWLLTLPSIPLFLALLFLCAVLLSVSASVTIWIFGRKELM